MVFSIPLFAQESGREIFDKSSASFSAFYAQMKDDSVFSMRSRKGFFPSLVNNFGCQATFPARMKQKDIFLMGGVTIVALTLINYDQEIDDRIKTIKNNESVSSSLSPYFTQLGGYYGYILLAGYGCYSLSFHKYRAFRVTLLTTQAVITTGLWIQIGKILSGRMRPSATYTDPVYNSDHWFGPFAAFNVEFNQDRGEDSFNSFPSGHSGTAFAMAAVLAEEYKDVKSVPYIVYSVAGAVAFTRMIEHRHWSSDVFIGGLIGYLCGKQVVASEKRLFPQYNMVEKKTRSYFYPVNYSGVYGLGWKLIF